MPQIELITPVYYGPDDPIHWEIDNLPLKSILTRQNLINLALDNVLQEMRDAIGTQGSVANRLNQSINQDGSLKTAAVDDAEHSIEAHTDGTSFVRMRKDQYDKLDAVADGATNVWLQVYTDENNVNSVDLNAGVVKLQASQTVIPSVVAPNVVTLNTAFPITAVRNQYYGQTPVPTNLIAPDYLNYNVNSVASPYIAGSLRVYINGVRIFTDAEVYVPGALVNDPWTLISFTENATGGTFELSAAITELDVIRIDYDTALV